MRRSGSSSCMLRPKYSFSFDDGDNSESDNNNDDGEKDGEEEEEELSVTVINTKDLSPYATERYYMLSEIEVHAHSMQFLCDFDTDSLKDDDKVERNCVGNVSTIYAEQEVNTEVDTADGTKGGAAPQKPTAEGVALAPVDPSNFQHIQKPFPSHVMLYLLWHEQEYPTPESFVGTNGPLERAVRQILTLNGEATRIHQAESAAAASNKTSPLASPTRRRSRRRMNATTTTSFVRGNGVSSPTSLSMEKLSTTGAAPTIPSITGEATAQPTYNRAANSKKDVDSTRIHVVVDRVVELTVTDSTAKWSTITTTPSSSLLLNSKEEEEEEEETHNSTPPIMDDKPTSLDTFTANPQIKHHTDKNVMETISNNQQNNHRHHHHHHHQIAEQLARTVATSKFLRTLIDGITIGISDNTHASPGLETIMDSMLIGRKERRRAWYRRDVQTRRQRRKEWVLSLYKSVVRRLLSLLFGFADCDKHHDRNPVIGVPSSSSSSPLSERCTKNSMIETNDRKEEEATATASTNTNTTLDLRKHEMGMICYHPNDVMGFTKEEEEGYEPDAVQGVIQSRTCVEWGGNGDYQTFALRAQRAWRVRNGFNNDDDDGGGGYADDNDVVVGVDNENGRDDKEGKKNGTLRQQQQRQRLPRQQRRLSDVDEEAEEEMSTWMVAVFVVLLVSYLWKRYGDEVRMFVSDVLLASRT